MSAPRTVSAAGVALIQRFESFSPNVYTCPAGKITVGWGHVVKLTDRIAPPITREHGLSLLLDDLAPIDAFLAEAVPAATQGQLDACASLAYNTGLRAFGGSTLLKKFQGGDIPGAAAEFLRWTRATVKGQLVELPGLVARRKAERAMFLGEC